jgi:L-serine/L-threonine ammonia-lyase
VPLHLDTPLLQSRALGRLVDKTVFLKIDALQPSGSFKLRSVGAACEQYKRQGKIRFVSSSGGNAGLAAANAGRVLDIPVTVVVPQSTPTHVRTLLEQEGATVIVHGRVWAEANELAQSLIDDRAAFLHPFDDPLLWTGHATLIDEVLCSGAEFDGVILSVGGGGLLSGVAEGLQRNGLASLPILAVETEGADCLARALAAGRNIPIPTITSIATTLGADKVADHAFEIAQERDVRSIVVSDLEALDACEQFLRDHRVLVEPACGASLAVLYSEQRRRALKDMKSPLIVVCGGLTATLDKIREWRAAAEKAAREPAGVRLGGGGDAV